MARYSLNKYSEQSAIGILCLALLLLCRSAVGHDESRPKNNQSQRVNAKGLRAIQRRTQALPFAPSDDNIAWNFNALESSVLSDLPSLSPSDMPSDTPSAIPSRAPVAPNGPKSVFDVATDDIDSVGSGTAVSCPVMDFEPFLNRATNLRLFEYTVQSSNSNIATQLNVTFYVTSDCKYSIFEQGLASASDFQSVGDWLNNISLYFGGLPRRTNGAFLTNAATPSFMDITLQPLDDTTFIDVQVVGNAVGGSGAPLMWGFENLKQAQNFFFFLLTMVTIAPQIFVKTATAVCGSGPSCLQMHEDVCFFDPNTQMLGLQATEGTTTYYDNSLQWFNNCAKSLGCYHVSGINQPLYFGEPTTEVRGTKFFMVGGEEVEPVAWECSNVQDAHALQGFVTAVAADPFRPFRVGGSYHQSGDLTPSV